MRYHYQFVSRTTVRIELIAEDRKEAILIEKLAKSVENDEQLIELFRKGLEAYSAGTTLLKTKFMNFPKVALCNYISTVQTIDVNLLVH